jgi:hypothetical protein
VATQRASIRRGTFDLDQNHRQETSPSIARHFISAEIDIWKRPVIQYAGRRAVKHPRPGINTGHNPSNGFNIPHITLDFISIYFSSPLLLRFEATGSLKLL